jgi:hypothetical protein
MTPERWLSKSEIAAHYGYSTRWVERQIRSGLPSLMMGGRRRFLLSECDAFFMAR